MQRVTIVVVGPSQCGKSVLVHRYFQSSQVRCKPTIIDMRLREDVIDSTTVTVCVVDTGGGAEFSLHRLPYIRDADAILFILSENDISYGNAMRSITTYVEQVADCRASTMPPCAVIVLSHGDSVPHRQTLELLSREVATALGVTSCPSFVVRRYHEEDVRAPWHGLIRRVLSLRPKDTAGPRGDVYRLLVLPEERTDSPATRRFWTGWCAML